MSSYRFVLQLILIALFTNISIYSINSQTDDYSSSEILMDLKKLNVLGSVLYIAAHPDDENTAVLTYMSKSKLTRTAYLSLTRGDGGQNLLGDEKGDLLGVIRTQELLSARKIDGANQFFTRAIDFGYSKTAKETLRNWDRDILLGDVVKVIREFRPDVILTRFSKTQGGHGHHLSSAILAEEAFYAAGDPNRYPEQLTKLKPWQVKRLYWNTWRPSENAVSIDIGEYNPIIGKSFNEISADARSMHKSQGFGVSPNRGSQLNYFDYMAGDTAKKDLFEDIELGWKRVKGGEKIGLQIEEIIESFDQSGPEKIVPELVNVYNQLDKLNDEFWVDVKKNELRNIIKRCSGLWMESTVWESELSLGENIDVRPMILNRSGLMITLEKITTSFSKNSSSAKKLLVKNEPNAFKHNITIPHNYSYSQPYWLNEKHDGKFFTISNNDIIGLAENRPDIVSTFSVNISGTLFKYDVPAIHKWNDAVKGEQTKPVVIRPEISISVDHESLVFPNGKSHDIQVNLVTKVDSARGRIFIDLPVGWKSSTEYFDFLLHDSGDQETFVFTVSPEDNAKSDFALFRAVYKNKTYSDEIVQIGYPHIKYQTVLKPVSVKLTKLDIEMIPKKIGYIVGSGDNIPLALSQIGYELDYLSDEDLDKKNLNNYDVIICGIRAFNTRKDLGRQQKRINDFVEKGGTWIVQHNTRFGIQVDKIGPYPFSTSGRDRISEEDAELQILVPDHQIFNYPNKITQNDFEDWVQERGLYFASSWEGKLYPLLGGNDEGEPSKLGGLLYSHYGKGVFIFTAYSWFRQLPAGVPGAYRLFVNMISAEGK